MSRALPRRGAAVLGSPIAHSLSPALHHAAYEALGLPDWSYRAVECGADELPETMRALDAEGLAGVSLTMPLKRAVVPLLAGMDAWAVEVAAANTVLFDVPGRWSGANTDVPGMVSVLRSTGSGAPAGTGSGAAPPWVLGAGATACAALAALAHLGHERAVVVARRPAAADALRELAERSGVDLEVRPWSEISMAAEAPLVVATTPAGATDGLAAALPAVRGLLVEVLYSPWPTGLARAWSAAGGQVVGGIELLVEQAVEQVALMTGRTPPAEPLRRAGYAAVDAR